MELQRKPAGQSSSVEVPPIVHDVLSSAGQPLDGGTRQLMESRFGEDFSKVRVHTDSQASDSALAVDALAYTVGRNVVFGRGQFASGTSAGQELLAHELTHVVQQTSLNHAFKSPNGNGSDHAAEREADSVARSVTTGSRKIGVSQAAGPQVQRQPVLGAVGWPEKGVNAAESKVQGMERIPLSGLDVGHQQAKGPTGRAIVVRSPTLDQTKPVDVLLHFHGHNAGYEAAGGKVRDDAIDNIEGQMASSARTQLIGILPQGTPNSSFGETAVPGKGSTKSFDVDAYVGTVLSVLTKLGYWKKKPAIAGVMLSGHSGGGELINEKILGSALGSNIGAGASPTAGSAAPKIFKELALFDAINGPNEHGRLYEFLQMKMTSDLAKVQQGTQKEREDYLKSSFKFRAYFSRSKYYSQWHVGPVPPGAVYKFSIKELITKFLATSAASLGGTSSPVYQAFEANYKVIDAGASAAHDKMVSHNDQLQDAIKVLPKRESRSLEDDPAAVPTSVYETLRSSGEPLDSQSLAWANNHFGHDMSGVRIHNDHQAAESARSIQSQAYTAGRDIVFGKGYYAPATETGRRLLAHELTHVIQQGEKPAGPNLEIGPQGDALEAQADRAASSPSPVSIAGSVSSGIASSRLQRAPTMNAAMCEATANAHPAELGSCNYKEPENCPTYEGWVSSFTLLKTFEAKDTPGTNVSKIKVFGGGPASKDFRPAPKGTAEPGAAPAPNKASPALKPGERFIDHPTDTWVQECLPANLRATAYQLPADCADVAMILRHVWLAAHHRTQKFNEWTLGSAAGKAEESKVQKTISAEGTQRVSALVAPYSDAQGKPLVSIKDLAPLLHAGDILVWWHYKKDQFDKPHQGGHTHTIAEVKRDQSGALEDLVLLQGNEPLFGRRDAAQPISTTNPARQKEDIDEFLKTENPRKARPTFKDLGTTPGRRVERATARTSGLEFIDSDPKTDKSSVPTWKWRDNTLLVAAGPSKAAARPPKQKVKAGEVALTRLSDWTPSFEKATNANLFDVFEAAMHEARAMIEQGRTITDDNARGLGEAAGQMVWRLAKSAKDFGQEFHFKVVKEMRAIIQALRISSNQPIDLTKPIDATSSRSKLYRLFGLIDEAFTLAARGGADIKFSTPGVKPEKVVKTLLTGFDPFNTFQSSLPPRAGEWNPSGAAVLAMDGKPIKLDKGVAAVEGIVLPVNFEQFKTGMVEKLVKPFAADVDAVLTVSVAPGLKEAEAVRFERYAVGSHFLNNGVLEQVPAAAGGGAGAAIIETNAPIEKISAETARKEKGKEDIPAPTFGEDITFTFSDAKTADDALKALGLKAQGVADAKITDHTAIQTILKSMTRDQKTAGITFKVGGKAFHALIVSGPGGNFLSNEISYRVLRLLAETKSPKNPISFHTHTEKGNLIPQDTSTPDAVKAKSEAVTKGKGIRDRLITTLTRMIQSIGKIIMARRSTTK